MFSQFFGNYLLENELISREELSEVLEEQGQTRLKLGVIAVNLGFMRAEEIDKVHAEQAVRDKRFGDIAVEMGFLSEKELNEALSTQKKEDLLMGQTLINKEIMTLQELQDSFEGYKKDNMLSEEQFKALKDNNVEKIVDAFLDFGSDKESSFYKEYTVLLINNLVRFIGNKLRIKGLRKTDKCDVQWGACQQILGDRILFTAMLAKESEFIKFAESYSEMEFDEADELAQDSVGEFMNLQNGIFLVNSSNNGIKLEMKPQKPLEDTIINFSDDSYIISLELEFGDVDFLISNHIYAN